MSTVSVDDQLLDSMRHVGDPIADTAVAEAFEQGAVHRVNDLLAGFHHNGDEVPAALPPLLREYFADTATQ